MMFWLLAQSGNEGDGYGKFIIPALVLAFWVLNILAGLIKKKQPQGEDAAGEVMGETQQQTRSVGEDMARMELERKRAAEMEAARRWAEERRRKREQEARQGKPAKSPVTAGDMRSNPVGVDADFRQGQSSGPQKTMRSGPSNADPDFREGQSSGPQKTMRMPGEYGATQPDVQKRRNKEKTERDRKVRAIIEKQTQQAAKAARLQSQQREELRVAQEAAISAGAAGMAASVKSSEIGSSGGEQGNRPRGLTAKALRGQLNPSTLRGAVLLSEILGKPVAMRPEGSGGLNGQ